jgi:hypothetical protein
VFKKLDNLSMREKVGLILALVTLLMLLSNALVVQPILGQLKRVNREIAALEETRRFSRVILGRRDKVEKAYASTRTQVGVAGQEALETGQLTMRVDDMAKQAGVALEARSPLTAKEGGAYLEFGIDIKKFEASQESLIRFLHAIAQDSRGMRVSRISINPGKYKDHYLGAMVVTRAALKEDAAPPSPESSPDGE